MAKVHGRGKPHTYGIKEAEKERDPPHREDVPFFLGYNPSSKSLLTVPHLPRVTIQFIQSSMD